VTSFTEHTIRGQRFTIYDFPTVGDELAVHVHDEAHNHLTVVARGSVRCMGHADYEGRVYSAGALVIWPYGKPHGFVAVEPHTRIINIAAPELTHVAAAHLP